MWGLGIDGNTFEQYYNNKEKESAGTNYITRTRKGHEEHRPLSSN